MKLNALFPIVLSGLLVCACSSPAPAPKIIKKFSGFTKIDATGKPLPDDASVWACVQDNSTGLMWEAKQVKGLHDKEQIFTWNDAFNKDKSFVTQVNEEGLCGFKDWRGPTKNALLTLVDKSRTLPAINTDFFPNTALGKYWSVSMYGYYNRDAWFVEFEAGKAGGSPQTTYGNYVMLVRTFNSQAAPME